MPTQTFFRRFFVSALSSCAIFLAIGCFSFADTPPATPSSSKQTASVKPSATTPVKVNRATPNASKTQKPAQATALVASASKKSKLDEIAPYRRFLWVTRWDFQTANDVEQIFRNAASARFTDVFFQVRGAGTVYYKSKLEPWAFELTSKSPETTGRDPGWDPLAKAITQAARYGIRVHAYINVLPGWRDANLPPVSSKQLYVAHKDWFMKNAKGTISNTSNGGFYAFMDPSIPEVRAYLSELAAELVHNYKVDGIHFDYIRYPHEKGDFSFHPNAVATFRQRYGASPSEKLTQWAQFKRDLITQTVREMTLAARRERPGIEVSAAVTAKLSVQLNESFQSAKEWVTSGLIDAITPMAYCGSMDSFETLCSPYSEIRQNVWLGVWSNDGKNTAMESQMKSAASKGFPAIALFAYTDLFPGHTAGDRAKTVYQVFTGS